MLLSLEIFGVKEAGPLMTKYQKGLRKIGYLIPVYPETTYRLVRR